MFDVETEADRWREVGQREPERNPAKSLTPSWRTARGAIQRSAAYFEFCVIVLPRGPDRTDTLEQISFSDAVNAWRAVPTSLKRRMKTAYRASRPARRAPETPAEFRGIEKLAAQRRPIVWRQTTARILSRRGSRAKLFLPFRLHAQHAAGRCTRPTVARLDSAPDPRFPTARGPTASSATSLA